MDRLQAIADWPALIAKARYCVKTLARNCGTSVSTLRNFFHQYFKIAIKKWLEKLRLCEFKFRLRLGERIKEFFAVLGYHDAAHASHDFKHAFGLTPREWKKRFAKRRAT